MLTIITGLLYLTSGAQRTARWLPAETHNGYQIMPARVIYLTDSLSWRTATAKQAATFVADTWVTDVEQAHTEAWVSVRCRNIESRLVTDVEQAHADALIEAVTTQLRFDAIVDQPAAATVRGTFRQAWAALIRETTGELVSATATDVELAQLAIDVAPWAQHIPATAQTTEPTITIDRRTLRKDPYALSNIMELDHVIRVNDDHTITPNPASEGDAIALAFYAETLMHSADDDYTDQLPEDWQLLTGYSGQYSYSGPVMHPSEFIGGHLAESIINVPGYYVALPVEAQRRDPLSSGGYSVDMQISDVVAQLTDAQRIEFDQAFPEWPNLIWRRLESWVDTEASNVDDDYMTWAADWIESNTDISWEDGEPYRNTDETESVGWAVAFLPL